MNAPLIVFGEDWGAHPSSTQHLIRRIAADRDVLWVNSIGMRRPRLNRADARRAAAKLTAMARRGGDDGSPAPLATPERLRVASATAVSWPGSSIARRLNRALIPGSLKPHLARLGERPILWTSLPTAVDAVGQFGEQAVVYYAGDDFEGLEGVDHGPVGRMERELAAKADLIIAASDVIAAKFPAEKTVVLTHGCDLELFSTPASRADDVPGGAKVAGFYGSLADWLDYEMLQRVASLRPDWQFQFVGNVQSRSPDLAALMALPNTRFRPAVPHAALPGYVQHWTAAILPFRDTPQIRACNPLKLREYLATGGRSSRRRSRR
ncbi:MAG: glycosyltransferase family 1 protein [Minwuia sp.]|uniref:glycosyltransferase family 1 protein n=1 Tax=Minwuia sp. TaxID=2493630 RepID=UPI003A863368